MKLFDDNLLKSIRDNLLKNGETISIAESVTSGLLQFSLSNTMDTVQFFEGGITAYNANQKIRQLNIEPMHALSVNCVSEQVAIQLAVNVRNKFQSDYGIAVTGYASPVPESGNKLYAYYAIAHHTRTIFSKRLDTQPLEGIGVQLYYVNEILKSFSTYLFSL